MGRVIAIILILAALALIGFSMFGPKSPTTGPGTVKREAQITLTEYKLNPDRIYVKGGRVKLVFTNQGRILHEIEIYDPVEKRVVASVEIIRIGESETLWVDLVTGRRYDVYDPIWRKKGMEGVIIVR